MLERELDAQDGLTVKVYPTRHGRRITSSSFKVSGVTFDDDPDSLKYTIGPDGQSVEFDAGDAAEDGQVVTGTIEGEQEGVDPGALRAPFSFTLVNVNPDGIDLEPTEPQPDGLGTDGGTAGPAPGPAPEPAPEPGGPEPGGIEGTSEPAPTAPGGTGTDGTGVGGADGGTEEPPPPPAPGPGGAPPPPPPPPQPTPMRAPGGPGQATGPQQVPAPGFRAPNPPPPPPPAPKPPAGRAPGAGGGNRGR